MKLKNKLNIKPDVVVIGVVTFLLQTISFVTTFQGAKVYIGNIFPLASLFFAIAIQFVVWYFANTLGGRRRGLKIVALVAAVVCSTWFSFTGIYNLINSPTRYLEERYNTIRDELLADGENGIDSIKELLMQDITDAAYTVGIQKTKLQQEMERLERCRNELDGKSTVATANKLRVPKESQYETYEEYAAAYQIYVKTLSQASGTELSLAREQLLSSYGFNSMEAYENAVRENSAAVKEIMLLADTEESGMELAQACIREVEAGNMPSEKLLLDINSLFSAAGQVNNRGLGDAFLVRLKACVNYCAQSDMASITELTDKYGIREKTNESSMEYKAAMDTEIASEKRRLTVFINAVQSDLLTVQREFGQTDTEITEVYLIPLQALLKGGITNPAYFCFAIAALVDGMTLILALSNIKSKPIWDRKWKQQPDYGELWEQIAGCTPEDQTVKEYINGFLAHFRVSEKTLFRGYLMNTQIRELSGYDTLTAVLCDSAHALIVNEELFLKADIVYWMNASGYKIRNKRERSLHAEYMEIDNTDMPSASSSYDLPAQDAASL